MKQPNTLTNKIVSNLWHFLAISLLVVAVLLSAVRIGLPHIDEANNYLTKFLGQRLNADLSIGAISAEWQQASPQLKLNQLVINASDGTAASMSIDELYVDIDVLGSILNFALVTNKFAVVGADINIYTKHDTQDNTLSKQADKYSNSDNNLGTYKDSKQSPTLFIKTLKELALNKLTDFSVIDSKVAINVQQQTHKIHIQQLSWLNQGQKHKGKGFISLENQPDNIASIAVDLTGDEDELEGQIYLETDNIALASLTQNLLPKKLSIIESNIDGQLWAHVNNSKISHIIGKINPSKVLLESQTDQLLKLSLNQLNFYAVPSTAGWLFNANDITLNIADKPLSLALVGHVNQQGNIDIQLTEVIDIKVFNELIQFTAAPENPLVAALPEASLESFKAHIASDEWLIKTKLTAINFTEARFPGAQDVTLDLSVHGVKNTVSAYADVQFNDSVLMTQALLRQNITAVNGSIQSYLTYGSGELTTLFSEVALTSNLTDIDLTVSYVPETEQSLSIIGSIAPQHVEHLTQLLPEKFLGQNTYQYLQSALAVPEQPGKVTTADILWHGDPAKFPFAKNDGIFQAQINVTDTHFLFAQGWPSLTELSLQLFFENSDLTMTAPSAQLLDVHINDLEASIPGLSKDSLLTINASAAGTGFALSEVMKNSNLKDSLGKLLTENIIISNQLSANLQLEIPFYNAPVVTKGNIELPNNYIVFNDIDTTLSQTKGTISFVNDTVSIADLSANLLGQPITIDAETQRQEDSYAVNIGLNGDWDSTELIGQLSSTYAEATAGSAAWEANIDLAFLTEGFTYDFSVSSNLNGIQINLAAPFNKTKDANTPFIVLGNGNNKNLNLQAQIGSDIKFEGVLPYSEGQFSRAHLALGNSEFAGLGMGFSISANLPEMYVDEWYETLDILLRDVQQQTQQANLFNTPERIFIDTAALHIAGQTIHNVQAVAKQADNNWQIDVNAEEARGNVKLFNDWLRNGIDINADFINLATINSPKDTQLTEVNVDILRKLPPLSFSCESCQILGKNLGEVKIIASPIMTGMKLEEVSFKNSQGSLQTSGVWLFPTQLEVNSPNDTGLAQYELADVDKLNTAQKTELGTTKLEGTLKSKDFGRFLNDFGLETGMRDSAADFDFAVSWDAAPYKFNFETLNGSVDWRLDDGYLTEISDQGSRIFTVLSLDSLIRKLSLDFRDVFAKGFFYEQIAGTLALENGVAITNDTVVDGGAGEIEIAGYSDLVNQELNYNMIFTPNVTGNLPALVYFMVSPPTALAALAVNEVLTSAKVFSNVEYSVSGTFATPVITELGRKSAEIQLPARLQPNLEDESAPLTELDKQGIPVLLPPPNS